MSTALTPMRSRRRPHRSHRRRSRPRRPDPPPPPKPPAPPPEPDVNPIYANADLSVAKHASTRSVTVGHAIDYRVIVRNHGPAVAQQVYVEDQTRLVAKVESIHTSKGSCRLRPTVRCSLGNLKKRRAGRDHCARDPATCDVEIHQPRGRRQRHRRLEPRQQRGAGAGQGHGGAEAAQAAGPAGHGLSSGHVALRSARGIAMAAERTDGRSPGRLRRRRAAPVLVGHARPARPARAAGRDGRRPICASSAGGSPGCGRRCMPSKWIRGATWSCSRRPAAGTAPAGATAASCRRR